MSAPGFKRAISVSVLATLSFRLETTLNKKADLMSKVKTPAGRLVEAFGDCEALAAMYTDDVTWRLNHSLPANIAGPHIGKAAVTAFNDAVFNKIYDGSNMRIEIHDEVGDEASSVVRFDIHAMSRRGNSYDVEYVLFAKTRGGLVYEVVELLDTLASTEQHQGNPVGVPPPSQV